MAAPSPLAANNPLAYSVLGTVKLADTDEGERRVITDLVQWGLTVDHDRHSWLERQRALTKLRYGMRPAKSFPWKNASNLHIPFIDHAIRKYKPILMRLVSEPDPICEFVGTDPQGVEAERMAEIVYNWLFKTEMDSLEPISYLIDTLCHRGFAFLEVGWDFEAEYEVSTVRVSDFLSRAQPRAAPGTPPQPPSPEQLTQMLLQEYGLNPQDPRVMRSVQEAVRQIVAGKQFVSLAFRHVTSDRPAIWERDPVQVLAPPRTTDYGNAERLIVQHMLSLRKIKQLEADNFFLPGTVNKILTARATETSNRRVQRDTYNQAQSATGDVDSHSAPGLYSEQMVQDEREKIWGSEDDDNIMLWCTYHWHDINNDGLLERTVTWIHPRSATKCRCAPYSMPFRAWPLVKFDFEKTTRRWHSPRGITQLLWDLQLEINAQHNARIDGMTLRNAPAYQIPVLANFRTRDFRVAPGTVIQTPNGAQLMPLMQDRGAFPEQVNEENLLRTLGEHYIGIFDAAITSPAAQTKARTATEISAIVQYTAATSTLDAILFQLAMRKVHMMVWQLYMHLAPDEIFLPVAGLDPSDPNAKYLKIRKADINRKFRLIPTGTVANTNRALELSNSREAVSMYANDQTGFINQRELRAWHIGLLAQPRWTRRILNSAEQAAELQILRQAAQAIQQDPRIMASMGGGTPVEAPEQPGHEPVAQSAPEIEGM